MKIEFLSEQDIIGKDKLDIFNKIGIEATPTDFAYYESLLLAINSGETSYAQKRYLVLGDNFYCTNHMGSVTYVDNNDLIPTSAYDTHSMYYYQKDAHAGIRLKVKYSDIKGIITDVYVDESGIKHGKCFNYMNNLVDNATKQEILNYYKALDRTNNGYIIFENVCNSHSVRRYSILYKGNPYLIMDNPKNENDLLVFKIEPCNLIIDEKNDIAVFENIISYGLKGLDLNEGLKNLSDIAMYYKFLSLFEKELMYDNKKEIIPINQINFNLSEEQLKHLIEKGKLTLIQENCPRVLLNIDSNIKDIDKPYVKTKNNK